MFKKLYSLSLLCLLLIFPLLGNSFQTQWLLGTNYHSKEKKLERQARLKVEKTWSAFDQTDLRFKVYAENYKYQNHDITRVQAEEFFFEHKFSGSQRLQWGYISPNLNHIDLISTLSPHQAYSYLDSIQAQWIGSPGFYYKKSSDDHKIELVYLVRKQANQLIAKSSPWLPQDSITQVDSDENTLYLSSDTKFYYLSDRILDEALKNNLLLKYSYNPSNYKLGAFIFQGSSSQSLYFDFSASLVSVDGKNKLIADSDVGIIPTYYKEFHWGHFGEWVGDSLIFKWEFSNKQDLSEEDYVKLNTTTAMLHWEWNSQWQSLSAIHSLLLVAKNSKQESSSVYAGLFELLDKNIIYSFLLSQDTINQWAFQWNQKVSKPNGSSFAFHWKRQFNDRFEAKIFALKFVGKEEGLYKSLSKNTMLGLNAQIYW